MKASMPLLFCCSLLAVSGAGAIGHVYTGVGDDGRESLELTSVTVDIEIEGRVAMTRTDQVFTNHAGRVLEGIYEFALPDGAIITDLVLWIDGKRIPGLILDKQLARNAYDAIVSGRADPALVEQVTPDLFRLSIFPFPANGSRRVELEYMEVLESRRGVMRYRFPLAPEGDQPVLLEQLILRAQVRSQHPIHVAASETAPQITRMERPDEFTARAFLGDERTPPQRDYELTITETAEPLSPTLLSLAPRGDEDGYFALWLPPVAELAADPLPRNVTFLMDVSRSMGPDGTAAARAGLAGALAALGEGDSFNVIAFGRRPVSFAESPVDATPENEEAAVAFAATWEAAGLSDLGAALEQALKQPFPREGPNHVVVFTDGPPSYGETGIEALGRIMEEAALQSGSVSSSPASATRSTASFCAPWRRTAAGPPASGRSPASRPAWALSWRNSPIPSSCRRTSSSPGWRSAACGPGNPGRQPGGQEMFRVGRYRNGGAFPTVELTGHVRDRSLSFEYPLEFASADDSQADPDQEEILLYEDFDDGVADGWQKAADTQGVWSVDADRGFYRVGDMGDEAVSRAWRAVDDSSYTIETRLRFDGHEGKVIFSEADRHEAWRLDLMASRGTARLSVGGIFIWGPPYPIERNVWYDVRIEIGEGLIDAYVNGDPVYEDAWLGGVIPDGVIGLGSYRADAEFDYVRVTRGIGNEASADRLTSIARLWAHHRVQALEDQIAQFGPLEELVQDILRLGLDYRLVTRATSLFAPEEGIQVNPEPRQGGGGEDEGWVTTAIGGEDSLPSSIWLGRTFRLREDDVWVDVEFRPSMEVEDYDPAADQPAELAAFAGLDRNLIVVIGGRAYRVMHTGPPAAVLLQNVPNPFNAATEIRFLLPAGHDPARARVAVYDLLGQVVRVLEPAALTSGGTARWDGRDSAGREVSSGVYIYRLEGLGPTPGRRMVLLR